MQRRPKLVLLEDDDFSNEDKKEQAEIEQLEDENDEEETEEEEEEEEEEDNQEAVCAICDDGGDLVCCDGPCLRSFHGTKSAAAKTVSCCRSLCLDESDVEETTKFYCLNCKYNQHQCFACGELGASAGESSEVILCDVAFCGRFYHPSCVSLSDDFVTGNKAFTCPLHKCKKCNGVDKKDCEDNRLYMCRRCPSAWHKKCIRDKIKFDGDTEESDDEDEREVRGWKLFEHGQGCARIMYCLKHIVVDILGTPRRNHLRFPEPPRVRKASPPFSALKKEAYQIREHVKPQDTLQKRNAEEIDCFLRADDQITKRKVRRVVGDLLPSKWKESISSVTNASVNFKKDDPKAVKLPSYEEADVYTVVYDIIVESRKVVTPDYIYANLRSPSTSTHVPNKGIQLGKIESALHAFHKAAECSKNPAGREEAQCILPPASLKYLERSKDTLKVYLAPFLHGMRYTSFGRHFTHTEKLKEIVEKLHWYVEPGDMIVDFSCGANEFSKLMHEKLEAVGKICKYKNFDILQPQNDFNFEKRDWMTVKKEELPSGNRLIMGLNPPFGLHGKLASQFAFHAAKFKPKMIVLIAPKETKRLEGHGYELIWEDTSLLKGPVFYLPGSLDVNEKIINNENRDAPPLYIWSRKDDWASCHKKIATKHGHMNGALANLVAPTTAEVRNVKKRRRSDSTSRHNKDNCERPFKRGRSQHENTSHNQQCHAKSEHSRHDRRQHDGRDHPHQVTPCFPHALRLHNNKYYTRRGV